MNKNKPSFYSEDTNLYIGFLEVTSTKIKHFMLSSPHTKQTDNVQKKLQASAVKNPSSIYA